MKNNIIERADDAIYIRFCSQTTINGNIIRNNRNSGISIISESYHNSIVDNTITNNNRYGIYLSWLVDNNTISKNTITGHSMGMQLSYLRDNIFCQNTLQDNNVGIFDEPNILIYWTQNNQFYHNNFINNELHATDYTENIWDDGYPSGGNYWDDYTGVDENADGIGDTAYPVYPGINEDRYPLMTPHQITNDLQIIIHKGFGLGVSAEITVLQSLPEETINWSIELRKGLILFPLKRTKEGSFSTPQVSESKKISTLVFGLGRIEIAVTAQTISKTANGFVLGPFVFVHGANEDPNESNDPLMIGENLIHHLKGD